MCVTVQSQYHYCSSTWDCQVLQAVNMVYHSFSILRSTFNTWIWPYCKPSICPWVTSFLTVHHKVIISMVLLLSSIPARQTPSLQQPLPFPLLWQGQPLSGPLDGGNATSTTQPAFSPSSKPLPEKTQHRLCSYRNTPVGWNTKTG